MSGTGSEWYQMWGDQNPVMQYVERHGGHDATVVEERNIMTPIYNMLGGPGVADKGARNLVANGGYGLYLKDLQTGAIICISTDATGAPAAGGGDGPAISGDDRFVAFFVKVRHRKAREPQHFLHFRQTFGRFDVRIWRRVGKVAMPLR